MTTSKNHELPGADFDHLSEEWAARPFDMWRKVRDEDSLGYSQNYGGYYLASRYEDVAAITRNPEVFSNTGGSAIPHLEMPPMPPVHFDPPDHTAYRRLINPYFGPSQINVLDPWIKDKVEEIMAPLLAKDEFDVLIDAAQQLTTEVTLRFMGIEEFPQEIHKWINDLLYKNADTPASSQKLVEFMFGELHKRRAAPGDDVLSGLVAVRKDGEPLSDQELVGAAVLITSAGLETTNSAIGGGTYYFLQNPEAKDQLLDADEKTWQLAMDEIVRWTSPASANARHVTQDTEVHGCPMSKGDRVLVMWGAANQDEREFPEPEKLILDRFPNRHMGFGSGPHRCVGSHLAKAMMRAYFERVLPELDDWRLADREDAVTWGGAETRGVRNLHLVRK